MENEKEVSANADDHDGEDPAAPGEGEGRLRQEDEIGRKDCLWLPRQPEAKEAYDRYARIYDEANAKNDYEMWLGQLLVPALEKHGLQKGWALDVGCGTGRAFEPLLSRGWQVVGCDISPGMLAEAERKFAGRVRVLCMDARSLVPIQPDVRLPPEKAFQLVLLLNDVVNYLTMDGDLEQVFAGVKHNLSENNGLVVFDANTLCLFRQDFTLGVLEAGADDLEWLGLTADPGTAGIYEARLSGPSIQTHIHRQRHWSSRQVKRALETSGLDCIAALGQREDDEGLVLSETPSEERDRKVVYIAAHVA